MPLKEGDVVKTCDYVTKTRCTGVYGCGCTCSAGNVTQHVQKLVVNAHAKK
jgi:hypothetical protein